MRCACSRSSRPRRRLAHMALRFPPVSQFLERWRSLLRRRSRFDFDHEVARVVAGGGRRRLPGAARAAQAGRDRDRAGRAVRADKDFPRRRRKESLLERPLRLIPTETTQSAELARTIEALLVVASQPLSLEDLQSACEADARARSATRSSCSASATPRDRAGSCSSTSPEGGRSARRATRPRRARASSSARSRRGCRRPRSRRSRSSRTWGRCSRPEIARIRGVNVDGVVAGLVERGLIAEAGRDNEFGAIRYRTTPLFERVFGLESLAALPRVDDLGADVTRDPRAARGRRREAHGVNATNYGRAARDALRAKRRRQHRLPGRRRRAVRPRLRPGCRLERRPDLGGSRARRVLRADRLLQPLDRLRQARDRRVGPGRAGSRTWRRGWTTSER